MIALLAAAFTGAASVGAGTACACSCAQLSPEETVKRADAIVVGTAVSEREEGRSRVYVFEVAESYKTAVKRRIAIRTSSQSAACGVRLPIGEQRTVVLKRSNEMTDWPGGAWTASLCSNLASRRPPPPSAGAAIMPLDGDDADRSLLRSPWVVAGGVLAGVVVVVGGALAIRRRRRTGS